jgi:hypothetical protein
MSTAIVIRPQDELLTVPAIFADAGDGGARRFLEFFTAHIRNPNTRAAYAQAVAQFHPWSCTPRYCRRLSSRQRSPTPMGRSISPRDGNA